MMSSLADLPELVGFFSYSREDDADSLGALSALRSRIQGELRGQLGRTAKTFRLWQDKEAIPSGTLWETEIKNAAGQAVFFIPIITPTVVASPYCRFELEAFLAREAELGRDDLVFPILYIDVPALEDNVRRQNDPVLSLIAKRQYVDWRKLRHREVRTTDASEAVERFCGHIRDALQRPWLSPEERTAQEKAATLQRAEDERKRLDAEARRQEQEARKREQADEERREREAAAEQQRVEAERQRAAEQRRRDEAEQLRQLRRSQARPLWPPPRPALVAGSLLGVAALVAVGAWLAIAPPTLTPPPAQVTPAPAPVAPTQVIDTPLSPTQERALKAKDAFAECTNCPKMMVVPAGSFTMGSPASEPGRADSEGPQHTVTIARQFAVGQFELTFDQWDACIADGGCNGYQPSDEGWGRGNRPVINVSWNNAKAYVAWLGKKTGKPYRLLSEAEYEYAARAGTTTAYPWGADIGTNNANCNGCGSEWDHKQTAPVGSFAANGFGLYDVVGNVWAWTEDCYHDSYNRAPTDGSAWTSGDCKLRVLRGGSWLSAPDGLRCALRGGDATDTRYSATGFRVGRTLLTP
jgi:formylglycine-generating enzyme required for sulfatase activity